jgi:hypothetical protein
VASVSAPGSRGNDDMVKLIVAAIIIVAVLMFFNRAAGK